MLAKITRRPRVPGVKKAPYGLRASWVRATEDMATPSFVVLDGHMFFVERVAGRVPLGTETLYKAG